MPTTSGSPRGERHPGFDRRAVTVIVGVLVVVAAAATIAVGAESGGATQDGDLVSRGNDIFGAECATCHGAEGRGIEGKAPPITDVSPALVDFVIRTGRMPLPDPNAPAVRREPVLTAGEREAVVAYVQTFAADEPGIPEVEPAAGHLGHGREIYESNCIACHSAFGRGIAVSQTDLAPSLERASPVEIAEAIRAGPGVMPVFGADILDEDDVNSVVRYIEFLNNRPSPGGLAIGRSGPVTEGFVAWLIGGVLLLVAIYLIGERRVD